MKGKEIIDALKGGKHVNVQSSTGRWIHATSAAPEGGVDGYNQYGDERTMGMGDEDEYEAYVSDYPGHDVEAEELPRGRRELPDRGPRPQRPRH